MQTQPWHPLVGGPTGLSDYWHRSLTNSRIILCKFALYDIASLPSPRLYSNQQRT